MRIKSECNSVSTVHRCTTQQEVSTCSTVERRTGKRTMRHRYWGEGIKPLPMLMVEVVIVNVSVTLKRSPFLPIAMVELLIAPRSLEVKTSKPSFRLTRFPEPTARPGSNRCRRRRKQWKQSSSTNSDGIMSVASDICIFSAVASKPHMRWLLS